MSGNHRIESFSKEKSSDSKYTNSDKCRIPIPHIQSINVYQEQTLTLTTCTPKDKEAHIPTVYTKQIRNNVSALSFLNLLMKIWGSNIKGGKCQV